MAELNIETKQINPEESTLGKMLVSPKVDVILQWSREQRLAVVEENKKRNIFQKAMGTVVGKVVTTGVEMIPSPWLYGPGDILTAVNAFTGKNLMTGERLDPVERVIHGVAAVIPLLPATPVVEAARLIRRGVEDVAHARRQKSVRDLHGGVKDIRTGVKGFTEVIKDIKSPKSG